MTIASGNGAKIDRRIRKTKKSIKAAFMDLASKNDVSKITVKDISDLADINRKTFYTYYNDVNDVTDDVANEMVENFLSLVNEHDIVKVMSNPYILLGQITKFISEDMEYYGNVLRSNISDAILEKFKSSIKDKLMAEYTQTLSVDRELVRYTIEYTLGGIIAAYREWLGSDRKISLEELSKCLSQIIANGLHPVYVNYK